MAYFALSLKTYADLRWQMDVGAVQNMLTRAGRRLGTVEPSGVVSRPYVRNFLDDPQWGLKSLKASNIDPLRSKKATSQVASCVIYLLVKKTTLKVIV